MQKKVEGTECYKTLGGWGFRPAEGPARLYNTTVFVSVYLSIHLSICLSISFPLVHPQPSHTHKPLCLCIYISLSLSLSLFVFSFSLSLSLSLQLNYLESRYQSPSLIVSLSLSCACRDLMEAPVTIMHPGECMSRHEVQLQQNWVGFGGPLYASCHSNI